MSALLTASAALFLSADAGRVEVEGLVLRAVARPSSFAFDRQTEYELEFSATPKGGGEMPIVRFAEPVRVVSADNQTLSAPSQFGPDATPRGGANRWTARLTFEVAPGKTLPAVEGALNLAPSQWKTATFQGAALKTNAAAPIEGGRAKLVVLDLDEETDIRFRVTLPAAGSIDPTKRSSERPIAGARATLIDAQAKETVLTSSGGGLTSDGTTTEHRLRFRGGESMAAGPLKGLRLEIPTAKGPEKKVRFRIPDVPVEERANRRPR